MTSDIRILIMDDNIPTTNDIIRRVLGGMSDKQSLPALMYGGSHTVNLKIQEQDMQLHLHCCKSADPEREREHIRSGEYDEVVFDLVLLDDQWGYEKFGGQDILLEAILQRVRGNIGIPEICYWTEHYSDTARKERLSNKIDKLALQYVYKIYYCHKSDDFLLKRLIKKIALTKLADKLEEGLKGDLFAPRASLAYDDASLAAKYGSVSNIYPDLSLDDLMIGISSHIKDLRGIIRQIRKSNVTVLIEGETGTGKQVLAQLVHQTNDNKTKNVFNTIDVSAFVGSDLLRSELFGHVQGAFTSALKEKVGLIEKTEGGTLFLDEIQNLDAVSQMQLLRLLDTKKYHRVGDENERTANVRIIAASNKPLAEMARKALFREDLMYRLGVIHLILPPLRGRREDIPQLLSHFYEQSAGSAQIDNKYIERVRQISNLNLLPLYYYDWPGNIRQLRNFVSRLVLLVEPEKHFDAEVIANMVEYERQRYGEPISADLRAPHYFAVLPDMLKWEQAVGKALEKNRHKRKRTTQKEIAENYVALYENLQLNSAISTISTFSKEAMFCEALKRRPELFPHLRQVFWRNE